MSINQFSTFTGPEVISSQTPDSKRDGAHESTDVVDFHDEQSRTDFYNETISKLQETKTVTESAFAPGDIYYVAHSFNRRVKTPLFLLADLKVRFESAYQALCDVIDDATDEASITARGAKLLKVHGMIIDEIEKINAARKDASLSESEIDEQEVSPDSYATAREELRLRIDYFKQQATKHSFPLESNQVFLTVTSKAAILPGNSNEYENDNMVFKTILVRRQRKVRDLLELLDQLEDELTNFIATGGSVASIDSNVKNDSGTATPTVMKADVVPKAEASLSRPVGFDSAEAWTAYEDEVTSKTAAVIREAEARFQRAGGEQKLRAVERTGLQTLGLLRANYARFSEWFFTLDTKLSNQTEVNGEQLQKLHNLKALVLHTVVNLNACCKEFDEDKNVVVDGSSQIDSNLETETVPMSVETGNELELKPESLVLKTVSIDTNQAEIAPAAESKPETVPSLASVIAFTGLVPDPDRLQREIEINPYISETERTTVRNLFAQYEAMKVAGKDQMVLDNLLYSIKDTVDTVPIDANTILRVSEARPFLANDERQRVKSLYQQHQRMEEAREQGDETMTPERLQNVTNLMKDLLETPADISYLEERVHNISQALDQMAISRPNEVGTARAMIVNFDRLVKLKNGETDIQNISNGLDKKVVTEEIVRQAYSNLEQYVLELMSSRAENPVEALRINHDARLDVLTPERKRRFEFITKLLKRSKTGLLAGVVALGFGQSTDDGAPNQLSSVVASYQTLGAEMTDSIASNLQTDNESAMAPTVVGQNISGSAVESATVLPTESVEEPVFPTAEIATGIAGVTFQRPEVEPPLHPGAIFSDKALQIAPDPNIEVSFPDADTSVSIDVPAPYQVLPQDKVWKLVRNAAELSPTSPFNELSAIEKTNALNQLMVEIRSNSTLQSESNIRSGNPDLIFTGDGFEVSPLVHHLDKIAHGMIQKEISDYVEPPVNTHTIVSEKLVAPISVPAVAPTVATAEASRVLVTPSMVEQFINNFSDGRSGFQKALRSRIEAIEGLTDTTGGWFSNVFGMHHESAFARLADVSIGDMSALEPLSPLELRREARARNITIDSLRTWLKVFNDIKESPVTLTGITNQTHFGTAVEAAFVAGLLSMPTQERHK